MSLLNWLVCTAFVPIGVTCCLALFRFPRLEKEMRTLAVYVIVSSLLQFLSLVLFLCGINNMAVLHVYVPLGLVLLAGFYFKLFDNYLHPRIIPLGAGVFVVFSVFNSIRYQDLMTYNSNAIVVQSVLVVVLSLSAFGLLMNPAVREEKTDKIRSLNWVTAGLFIYHASNLVIFYFGETILHNLPKWVGQYSWLAHSFFMSVMYSFFFVALWIHPKK